MMFSGIETLAISIIAAMTSSVLTVFKMTGKYVKTTECIATREACGKLHALENERVEQQDTYLQASIDDLKRSNRIQNNILRALVSHMPNISPEVRSSILNSGNGED